ncbi:hypothetical protein [Candidatus Electronema sp. TJ]|uniref:hypothetical protein n=1 Tax=Candidatus Electronema sp. TJ TaxID=3401573 RepID=UPI003AA9BCE8
MAPSIDEFQDLTQFADESFDTDEVDLFEFADDEDSPLLRLKSIVLSLDWDITEDILGELNEELASLRAMWKDDKVAQIYLQGMENVGKYLREEGAYAHPNAIKLLLTLYHNYEKIISSTNISGETITTMLKADIRKFKVLQYQISSLKNTQGGHEHAEAAEAKEEAAAAPLPEVKKKKKAAEPQPQAAAPPAKKKEEAVESPSLLRSMEATILGLEWEVTDEGLEKFSSEAAELRNHLSGNTEAQVLIQGLQALGSYIREQKTNAHPDSFTILHSFYDSLKMLLESPELGAEQRRQILIEQISSLNSLKEVIARSAAEAAEEDELEDEAPEAEDTLSVEENADADDPTAELAADDDDLDIDALFDDEKDGKPQPQTIKGPSAPALPAAKHKAAPAPPPAKLAEIDEDEDEFGDDFFSSGSGGIMPALADEDEEGGFNENFASAGVGEERAAELDEKLNSFFDFDDLQPPKKAEDSTAPQSLSTAIDDTGEEEEDVDASFFNFDDEEDALKKKQVAAPKPPLAEIIEETEKDEPEEEEEDVDASFFDFDDEESGADAAAASDALSVDAQQAVASNKEPSAALSDDGFGDDGLESFFSFDEAEEKEARRPAAPTPKAKAAPVPEDEDEDGLSLDAGLFGGDMDESPAPALADEDAEEPSAALSDDGFGDDGLDSFFSFDEAEEKEAGRPAAPAPKAKAAPVPDEDDEDGLSLDAGLFGGDMEEGPAPALEDEDAEEPSAALSDDGFGDDGLENFFSFDEAEEKTAGRSAAPAPKAKAAPEPEDDDEDGLSLDAGLFGGDMEEGPAPALEDEDAEEPSAALSDDGFGDDGLENFFSFDEAEEKTAGRSAAPAPKAKAAPEPEDDDEDGLSLDAGLFGGDMEEGPAPALADEDAEEPSAALSDDGFGDDGLENFFSFDEAEEKTAGRPAAPAPKAKAAPVPEEDDEDGLSLDAGLFGGDMDESPAPALADEDAEEPSAALSDDGFGDDGLESFFSFDEAEEKEAGRPAAPAPKAKAAPEPEDAEEESGEIDIERAAEIRSKLDSLFNFDDEAAELPSSSLAAEEEPHELEDEFITSLDDDSSGKPPAAEEEDDFFSFKEDATAEGEEEAVVGVKEPPAEGGETDSEQDSFFGFDTMNDDTAESLASIEEDEQDEQFGMEEEENPAAESNIDSGEGEAFFAFSSGEELDENGQADKEVASTSTEAAEEDDEDFFAFNADEELGRDDAGKSLRGEDAAGDRLPSEADDEFVLGRDYETDDSQAADRVEMLFAQDDLPDPFFSMTDETEEPEQTAAAELHTSLASLAASLTASPSSQALRQISALAAAARQEGPVQPQQSIVLDLLESSTSMLAKAPLQMKDGCAVVQELASSLALNEEPAALAATVSRYTAWQRQFFEQLLKEKNSPDTAGIVEAESQEEGVVQLQQLLHNEFRQLRQELLAELSNRPLA